MSKHQELSSFIWNVCDDVLRGLFKQHEYGDVILPFVVLRRLDCVLEPHKDEVFKLYEEYKSKVDDPSPIIKNSVKKEFYNFSKYDLVRLKSDPKNIYINFQNYINGYSKSVFEIIENFQFEKPVEKLHKNNKLYLLIDKFTEIDLHPNVVDNHTMGNIFEELLRKFSEMSNETSGEHYTPRDVVNLLVSMVFTEGKEDLKGEGKIRSVFDPCCGTGGLLTLGKQWILENINSNIEIKLSGQELNPQTYSICKSDMLISGENPDNIKLGSSLSEDGFQGERFDYMITNPPFGVSWKSEKEFVLNESENPKGRFSVGTPKISDGSLLFLQHMISKMEPKGSRIGVIFNGSPLFSGDSGKGESEIRRWIIENDWLETIVQLPDSLFFNTGITTYIWIVSNKKSKKRKGKIQLIDGSTLFVNLKKSLGSKRKYIGEEESRKILQSYLDFKESSISKIFPNEFFGYKKMFIQYPEYKDGKIVYDKKHQIVYNKQRKDFERVGLHVSEEEYYQNTVKPFNPHCKVSTKTNSIGYEINFKKYFHKFKEETSLVELVEQINYIDKEIVELTTNTLNNQVNTILKKRTNINDLKEVNDEWMGVIPVEWELIKVRFIFESESNSISVEELEGKEVVHYSIPNVQEFGTGQIEDGGEIESSKLILSEGLIIISKLNPRKGTVCIVDKHEKPIIGSGEFIPLHCNGKVRKFRFYQLMSSRFTEYLDSLVESVTKSHQRIRPDKLYSTLLPSPSEELQEKIGLYLDSQINELDKIVELEKRKIELINLYKRRIIFEITTGKVTL